MKISITKPKVKIDITKPIFTIKYSDKHQIISTTNFWRFLFLSFRTLFTGHKYLDLVDKSCGIFKRPTVCTIIVNDSENCKVNNLCKGVSVVEYCPTDIYQGIKPTNPLEERFGKYIPESTTTSQLVVNAKDLPLFTTTYTSGLVINASELPYIRKV